MYPILQGPANGRGQFAQPFGPATDAVPRFRQQTLEVQMALCSAGGRLTDTEPWPQPAPERGRDQELNAPAQQTRPVRHIGGPAETGADRPGTLPPDAVAPERFDDDRGRIPAPRVEPVGQAARGMAASQTEEAPHPDHDPGRFRQTPDLPRVQAVADQLQNAIGLFPCRFPAEGTELRTEGLERWGIRAVRAQLLDREGEAM